MRRRNRREWAPLELAFAPAHGGHEFGPGDLDWGLPDSLAVFPAHRDPCRQSRRGRLPGCRGRRRWNSRFSFRFPRWWWRRVRPAEIPAREGENAIGVTHMILTAGWCWRSDSWCRSSWRMGSGLVFGVGAEAWVRAVCRVRIVVGALVLAWATGILH